MLFLRSWNHYNLQLLVDIGNFGYNFFGVFHFSIYLNLVWKKKTNLWDFLQDWCLKRLTCLLKNIVYIFKMWHMHMYIHQSFFSHCLSRIEPSAFRNTVSNVNNVIKDKDNVYLMILLWFLCNLTCNTGQNLSSYNLTRWLVTDVNSVHW